MYSPLEWSAHWEQNTWIWIVSKVFTHSRHLPLFYKHTWKTPHENCAMLRSQEPWVPENTSEFVSQPLHDSDPRSRSEEGSWVYPSSFFFNCPRHYTPYSFSEGRRFLDSLTFEIYLLQTYSWVRERTRHFRNSIKIQASGIALWTEASRKIHV